MLLVWPTFWRKKKGWRDQKMSQCHELMGNPTRNFSPRKSSESAIFPFCTESGICKGAQNAKMYSVPFPNFTCSPVKVCEQQM